MPTERVTASARNLRVSLTGQLMTVIFNFICRRIFLRMLGSECMGFSGLCGHFLNFLSLIEPGFDAACIYCLYRPLAFGDDNAAAAIMTYIKKIYRYVAALTFLSGLALSGLLIFLTHDDVGRGFALTVYLISLTDMSLSYLFSHRRILPIADQKSHVIASCGYVFFMISRLCGLFVLSKTGDYILYLLSGTVIGLLQELTISRKVKKMYPGILCSRRRISDDGRHEITSRVRALFFHKAGAIMCGSVDNMAVFIFLGLHGGTVYSNYTMLTGICLTFISIVTGSAAASVGNLGVTSGKDRMMKVYSTAFFAVFIVGGFFALSLFFAYPAIIELWVGKDMILGTRETALFCTLLLISSLRKPTGIFLDGLGLFDKEKYKAVIEALLTLAATLALSPRHGISGVLAGQIIGSVCSSFWYEPYILFKAGFQRSALPFIRDIFRYTVALALSFILSGVLILCLGNGLHGIMDILFRIAICAFSVISVFFILFFDSERLSELIRYGKKMLSPRSL